MNQFRLPEPGTSAGSSSGPAAVRCHEPVNVSLSGAGGGVLRAGVPGGAATFRNTSRRTRQRIRRRTRQRIRLPMPPATRPVETRRLLAVWAARAVTSLSMSARHRSPTEQRSYLLADFAAPSPSSARRAGSAISARSAEPKASMSPSSTRNPFLPSRMSSRGPRGQSNATTGTPCANASIATMGSPSKRDGSAKIAASARTAGSVSQKPFNCTCPPSRRLAISRLRALRFFPLP